MNFITLLLLGTTMTMLAAGHSLASQNTINMINGPTPIIFASDGASAIYYAALYRYQEVGGNGTVISELGTFQMLIGNLTYQPQTMEFCFMKQILFVCSGDGSLIAYKLNITTDIDPPIVSILSVPDYYHFSLLHKQSNDLIMQCSGSGGLKLDKFGNLFFIYNTTQAIMMVTSSQLDLVFNLPPRPELSVIKMNITCQIGYTSDTTNYITNLQSITIEREYLYWTNAPLQQYSGYEMPNAISKAFTMPFVKHVPLQTFFVNIPTGAQQITINSAFLFFTSGSSLFAMNKHGYTDLYFDLGVSLSNPTTLYSYLDNLLIVTESNQISAIEVTQLALTSQGLQLGGQNVNQTTQQVLAGLLPNGLPANSIVMGSLNQGDVSTAFVNLNQASSLPTAVVMILICSLSLNF